jgi:ribosomal protein S18 acetylase RimI-like enzyme
MAPFLDNPVYHALLTGDAQKSHGTQEVKYFDREISPFAGFSDEYKEGFYELNELLPAGREILYASRKHIDEPHGWKLLRKIEGLQFVLASKKQPGSNAIDAALVPLESKHADEMVALAALTRPGPFDKRTIEFGNYFGIFDKDKLVAMTGQRLHPYHFTEVSAVCTHPGYLGRGYASLLLDHQLDLILNAGQVPFLHVKSDNARAIFLYERIGFKVNGLMNFYFMKKMDSSALRNL